MNSNRFEKLLSGSQLILIGLAIRSLVLFIVEIILARHFGPAMYGSITWCIMFINILAMVASLGLNTSTRRFVPIYVQENETKALTQLFKFTVTLSTTASILILIAVITTTQFTSWEETDLVKIMIYALPFWVLQRLLIGYLGGLKFVRAKVLVEDIATPIAFLLTAVMASFYSLGAGFVLIAYAATYALSSIVLFIYIVKYCIPSHSEEKGSNFEPRQFLKFSWPLIFTDLLGKSVGIIEIFLIGVIATVVEVGLFKPASDLAASMSLILMAFGYLFLPLASEFFAEKNYTEWRLFNTRVARLCMVICAPIFSLLFIFPSDIITIFYGDQYSDSAPILFVLAFAYFMHCAVGFTGLNLVAGGYTKHQLIAKLVAVTVMITFMTILLPRFGATGAAYSILLSLIFSNFLNILFTYKFMKIQPFDLHYFRALGILLMLMTICYALYYIIDNIVLRLIVAELIVCGGLLFFFWKKILFNEDDRNSILAMVNIKRKSP